MPETREEDSMIIFFDHQVMTPSNLEPSFLEEPRVVTHLGFQVAQHPAWIIDGNELFVQMIKRCACRFEPVLKSNHVGGMGISLI